MAPQPFYTDRGTPIALRHLLEALAELNYRVDLLTYAIGRDLDFPGLRIFRAGNPLRIRQVPVGFSLRKVLLDVNLIAALRSRLRAQRYLCVHAVEELAYAAVLLAPRRGVPVVYDMQSSIPEQMTKHRAFRNRVARALLRGCERWLLRRADLIVSSAGLSARVRRLAPEANVREWRFPGLDAPRPADEEIAELRSSLGIPAGVPVVTYCGTFEKYQGLDDLLAAVRRVRREVPGAVLMLVGGELSDDLLKDAADLLQAGALRVVDRQPRERMPAFLSMADVLVSPRAYGNNLPLKIFDYLMAGRPIVATDIRAHRSVLDESRAVLVRPAREELAAAIAGLLRDPDRAAALGAAARGYARHRLSWPAFVRSVYELYAGFRDLGIARSARG